MPFRTSDSRERADQAALKKICRNENWCLHSGQVCCRISDVLKSTVCASGSVVEYRLAKAGVAGSNPVSRSLYAVDTVYIRIELLTPISGKKVLDSSTPNMVGYRTRLTGDNRGEVSEWFKELVLKTSDSARGRGFESHLLRSLTEQNIEKQIRAIWRSTQAGRRGSPGKGVGR